jgi:hypothetical protein
MLSSAESTVSIEYTIDLYKPECVDLHNFFLIARHKRLGNAHAHMLEKVGNGLDDNAKHMPSSQKSRPWSIDNPVKLLLTGKHHPELVLSIQNCLAEGGCCRSNGISLGFWEHGAYVCYAERQL